MKTIEEYFRDWESNTFGMGYGSGEPYTIPALRKFLGFCRNGSYEDQYDYEELEKELSPTVAWLLINILGNTDILEYGTSPRYAWLTPKGTRLKQFMLSRTAEELIDIVCSHSEGYVHCYPDACNCAENGYDEKLICQNPFWLNKKEG